MGKKSCTDHPHTEGPFLKVFWAWSHLVDVFFPNQGRRVCVEARNSSPLPLQLSAASACSSLRWCWMHVPCLTDHLSDSGASECFEPEFPDRGRSSAVAALCVRLGAVPRPPSCPGRSTSSSGGTVQSRTGPTRLGGLL